MNSFWTKLKSDLYEWFIASNRWLHLIFGWAITLIVAIAIGLPQGVEPVFGSMVFGSYLATLIAMMTAEFKDKAKGGKFDWKDVNAGMFLANILLIIWLISAIFN
jgi:hypothetical protein